MTAEDVSSETPWNLLIFLALSRCLPTRYRPAFEAAARRHLPNRGLALSAARKASKDKPDIVDITAEDGEHVEPPPPEVVEPDPDWTEEEAEQARKDYLLTRFWMSARGFWGKGADRLAWLFTIGLLVLIVANVGFQYGINVWNRAIFDAIEKKDSGAVSSRLRSSSLTSCAAISIVRSLGMTPAASINDSRRRTRTR